VYIITEFLKQKDRWILWSPVAMALGIGAYFSLKFEPSLWVGLFPLIIITLKIVSIIFTSKSKSESDSGEATREAIKSNLNLTPKFESNSSLDYELPSISSTPSPSPSPSPSPYFSSTTTPITSTRHIQHYGKLTRVLILLPLFLFTLGFTAAQFRTGQLESPVLNKKTYPLMLKARVVNLEALPNSRYRITLDKIIYKAKYSLPQKNMPNKIRIRLKKKSIIPATGDIIKVKAILLPLSSPVMAGAFDFQRYAFFKGIGATGFTISNIDIIRAKKKGFFFPALRRYLRDNIKANIKDSDKAAIVIALLDGENRDISNKTNKIIRAAGIAHLMAISGLHVAIVTGFFFFLIRGLLASIPYIALRYPIKKITAFIAMLGAIFYMMLIGDSVSAERSVIMVCVIMIAIIMDRDALTLRLAAFAASVMLLFQPEILFGASFQMSFAAVVALIAFYESTKSWWRFGSSEIKWWHKIYIYLQASVATTLVATIATAPFSLFHFLRSTLFPGIFANIIAVPLSSFITIPSAILGSFLMPLGLENYPLKISEWSVGIILKTAETVSKMPYAVFNIDYWPMWILAVISLGAVWICLWVDKIRWLGFIPIIFAIAFIPFTPRADIIISNSGKIFAVRNDNGILWISSKRKEKFTAKAWLEREAEQGHNYWNKKSSPVKCDKDACLYKSHGKIISFIKRPIALSEDCPIADVIITNLYVHRKLCRHPKVIIDRWKLKTKGAHSIYFKKNGGFEVKTVGKSRGSRPWVSYR